MVIKRETSTPPFIVTACSTFFLVVLALSGFLFSADAKKAAQAPVPVEIIVGSPGISTEADSSARFIMPLTIKNRQVDTLTYILLGIHVFASKTMELVVNGLFDTTGVPNALPYQTSKCSYQLLRPSAALSPGQSWKTEIVLTISGNNAKKIKSFSVQTVGYGGAGYGTRLMGCSLIPEQSRKEISEEISRNQTKKFSYIKDSGEWAFPEGLDSFPAASEEEQNPDGDAGFQVEETGGDSVSTEIKNAADRTVTVTIMGNGRPIVLPVNSGKTKAITLPPGMFSFTGTAENVVPCSGTKIWKAGRRYTWRFWIE
jgi:hypothetical protein